MILSSAQGQWYVLDCLGGGDFSRKACPLSTLISRSIPSCLDHPRFSWDSRFFFPCWSVSKDPLKVEMVVTRWCHPSYMCFALQSPVFLDTCHKYLVGGFIFFHFLYGMSSFPLTLTPSCFKMVSVTNQVLSPKKVVGRTCGVMFYWESKE